MFPLRPASVSLRPRFRSKRPVRAAGSIAARYVSWALCVGLALCGCETATPPQPPPPPEVFAATPLAREVVEWDDYTARLRAVKNVEIRPRVGGYLQQIHFADGDEVKEGDKLFTIDPRPFQAALAEAEGRLSGARAALQEAEAMKTSAVAANVQAEAALELRDTQLARIKKLVDRGAETQESYDIEASQRKQAAANVAAARAQIKSAEAAIKTAEASIETALASKEAAELKVSFTVVYSPIDGLTSRHLVDVGNLVVGEDGGNATLLTTIVSQRPIHAFVSAPERAFLKYTRQAASGERPSSREVQNPAVLQLADEEGYPHVGAIDFVENTLDAGTDTMTGRLEFPNPTGLLTPGLFAKVKILGSGIYEAMLVPDSAVTLQQNKPTVLVVVPLSQAAPDAPPPSDDGSDEASPPPDAPPVSGMTVEQRTVTLGPLIGGLRVIRDGLGPAERIVIRGVQKARPGSPVRVKKGEIKLDEEAFERDARLDLARAVRARRNAEGVYELPSEAENGATASDPAAVDRAAAAPTAAESGAAE